MRRVSRTLISCCWIVFCAVMPAGGASADQILTRSTTGEAGTLDPHRITSAAELPLVIALFEGLATVDRFGNTIPGAAHSWETSTHGLTYVFHLRDGLVWSDGTPMTSDDFVWSLRRYLDPATANPLASQLFMIENAKDVAQGNAPLEVLGVTAPDERTVQIKIEQPVPYFPDLLLARGLPVPRHVIEAHGQGWTQLDVMVSNGAFNLAERVPQSHVLLKRNPMFRDAAKVALDGVRFIANEDLNTGLKRYLAGDFHMALNFPQSQLEVLRETHAEHLRLTPFPGYDYYAFNTMRPPFDDRRVRRALSMAVDRDLITNRIQVAGDYPAYSYVVPGTSNYGDPPKVDFSTWSMEKRRLEAKKLLAEVGFGPDNRLTFTLKYNSRNDTHKVAEVVSSMWRAIGVHAKLYNAESQVHRAALVNGDFEVARWLAFAEVDDPTNFLKPFQSDSGPASNITRYANPEFDRLVIEANQTLDIDQRAQILREAESMLLSDHPAMPLYFIVTKKLVAPEVRGWVNNLRDIHLLRYVSLKPRDVN